MSPSAWCKKMMDEATNGEDAYNYHQMMEMWQSRGL